MGLSYIILEYFDHSGIMQHIHLLPTGSEEREVLGVGSVYENYCIIMNKYRYSWVVKIRNTSEAVLRLQYTPWPSY